jgi:hypothetical protein
VNTYPLPINHPEFGSDGDCVGNASEIDFELPSHIGVLHFDRNPGAVAQHANVHLPNARRTKWLFAYRLELFQLIQMIHERECVGDDRRGWW